MFSIQTLGSAASLLILLPQTPLLHMDSISVKSQSFGFSFMFDCLATFTSQGIFQTVCSISLFTGSCARCSSASWHQTSGMEPTGRMGHSTERQLEAGIRTSANGFLSSQQQTWPITPDFRAVRWLHVLKTQKLRPEKSHAEPGQDRIFSCYLQHH